MKNYLAILLLLVTILALAACGGGANREGAAAESNQAQAVVSTESINVVMNDIYYGDTNDNATDPPVWTVTSGSEVSVSMDNQGVLEHNWAVVNQISCRHYGHSMRDIPANDKLLSLLDRLNQTGNQPEGRIS